MGARCPSPKPTCTCSCRNGVWKGAQRRMCTRWGVLTSDASRAGAEGAGAGQREVVLDMNRRVDILFDVVGRLGKFAVQDDVAKHRFRCGRVRRGRRPSGSGPLLRRTRC
ncbi:unnamed protein product [Ectocarpus sp. 12 AP-2014]